MAAEGQGICLAVQAWAVHRMLMHTLARQGVVAPAGWIWTMHAVVSLAVSCRVRGSLTIRALPVVLLVQNARNVLVCSTPSGGVTAKLADLGISRVIKQHSTHRTTNTVGTVSHMVR